MIESNSSMSVSEDSGDNSAEDKKSKIDVPKANMNKSASTIDNSFAQFEYSSRNTGVTTVDSRAEDDNANGAKSGQKVSRKRKEAGASSLDNGNESYSHGIVEPPLKTSKHGAQSQKKNTTPIQTPLSSLGLITTATGLAAEKNILDSVTPTPSSNSNSNAKTINKSESLLDTESTPDTVTKFDREDDDLSMDMPECDPVFRSLVNLDPIPDAPPIIKLCPREVAQLELSLQIGDKFMDLSDDTTWREHWHGNLQLLDKDIIMNRDDLANNPDGKQISMQFCDCVAKLARHSDDFTAIKLLFSFVYHMKGTPPMTKKILAYNIQCPASSVTERLQLIMDASERISYDPMVLTQDGWTTVKSDVPDGHTSGSYLIGRRVIWQNFEAIVIAFVRDEDSGDLWRCLWIEDLDTFDLEADELQEGMAKWEKKVAKRKTSSAPSAKASRPSIRFAANRNFSVDGIEEGMILAKSYKSKGGQPWPARVMHVTEVKALGIQLGSRRSSSKNEIHIVFLAPFWNGHRNGSSGSGIPTATSQYATGPLFELETIDVSEDTIQKYPYSPDDGTISISSLRSEFSFLGLPKAAFPRFLHSHRLAMALKNYARRDLKLNPQGAIDAEATASLTDTHPMSIKTFSFPDALLNLPFEYILSKHPDPMKTKSTSLYVENDEVKEPIMQLHGILTSITPPHCWNERPGVASVCPETPTKKTQPLSLPDSKGLTPTMSPTLNASLRVYSESDKKMLWNIDSFASSYLLQVITSEKDGKISPLHSLYSGLDRLVKNLNKMVIESEEASVQNLDTRQENLSSLLVQCMTVKGQCEENLFSIAIPDTFDKEKIVKEWRRACERIFKRAIVRLGHVDAGNGVTAVLTDSRCNEHITASGSFERAVRLPAAVKGARNAGAGTRPNLPIITKIEDAYLTLAEEKILPMAHKASYLKRMKKKITALAPDAKGIPLTDDSDGEGGEDTMGSRGSFTAAVTAVAVALKGVDMIVGGKCVNAFCAIRPPGHHAGRELRPMNAISNGFCLLNAAASAALYAAAPRSQGGLGLKRVCIIDIDLHHGNGTQDILCSTYDPRFLYVSTHAGGPHINGFQDDASDDGGISRGLKSGKNEGIFPGRCGDISPHPGVLNIPLGNKVTPSSLGTALVCQVTPAVQKFDPELIIISAGFDAHVNDPLGMGGLTSQDFGTVTKVICQMALRSCSGRILSVLEGGYGVPCCRPLETDLFLPKSAEGSQLKLLNLGEDLPDNMDDKMDTMLARKLDKCHQDGFSECVREHVRNLALGSNVEG